MMRLRSSLQPYPIYTTVLTGKNLPPHLGYRVRLPRGVLDLLESQQKPETPPEVMRNKIIQTMFRESEAQTDPYEVDVAEGTDKGLEILTLGWLSWNNGLPAGMNEINTIERARQKRAWESALPIPHDERTKEIRTMIIEAMEINEWNYREEMIAAIGSLRLELSEKLMKERCRENKQKYDTRLSKYVQAKREEKNQKIQKLRTQYNRKIRKLALARRKINRKYHRMDIVKQFTDKTSEMYAPQMRFGEDPRHWHEEINPAFAFSKVFRKLEILHLTTADIPRVLMPAFDFKNKSKPKGDTKDLCIKSTKWTQSNLEKLHEELRNIRRRGYKIQRPCYLKKKVVTQAVESETPFVVGVPDDEEALFQACLFLQRTIKGRAIQAVMFEGRVKCQELIEELKSTHALQDDMEDVKAQMRKRVYGLQRQAEIEQMQESRKNEILCALEGKTTGDMLDFLSKELLRLQDERKTHALALAADRERHKREAAEAGRRQLEEQRRREHDEMFKQVIKMHQNIVQAILEETMVANRHWLAQRDAREYISEMAKKVDQAAMETANMPVFKNSNNLRDEELIADLIHNFALPEAEKRIVRKRMKDKQKNYLRVCHDEVYSNIEKVVQGPRDSDGVLLPLPMQGKHRVPPLIRVKYLHLKRMHEASSSTSNSANSDSNDTDPKFSPHQVPPGQQVDMWMPRKSEVGKVYWSSGFSRHEVILKSEKNG